MSVEATLDTKSDDDLEATIARLANRGERLVFSIPETALLLGISRALAYELARRGELPTMQLGRRRVVPRTALAHYIVAATAESAGDVA